MSSILMGPPTPQTLSPGTKSLNDVYESQRKKTYATTQQGKTEVIYQDRRIGNLFKIAVYATIAFFILSNMSVFNVVNKIIATFSSYSNLIVDESGMPTLQGNFIHTGVFFVIIMILLFFM